jgi:hypothetical protein
MKAVTEAIVSIKSDPEGSMEVLAKYLSLDIDADRDSLEESYNMILLDTLQDIPYPTMEGLQNVIDVAIKDNPDLEGVKPEDVVDISIVEELEDSGFISNLK